MFIYIIVECWAPGDDIFTHTHLTEPSLTEEEAVRKFAVHFNVDYMEPDGELLDADIVNFKVMKEKYETFQHMRDVPYSLDIHKIQVPQSGEVTEVKKRKLPVD